VIKKVTTYSGAGNEAVKSIESLLNCLYLAAELWDWLEKHLSVFKALARILV
jgi:hypothetical protein